MLVGATANVVMVLLLSGNFLGRRLGRGNSERNGWKPAVPYQPNRRKPTKEQNRPQWCPDDGDDQTEWKEENIALIEMKTILRGLGCG
jgi:hypothetical protein